MTERLELPCFQDALIDCIIHVYRITSIVPWNNIDLLFGTSGTMFTGLKKLVIDILVYRQDDERTGRWMKRWVGNGEISHLFFAGIASKMMNKSAIPPYMKDPSRYYST